jgi:hypothetical protein
MQNPPLEINCHHGKGVVAVVCGHLVSNNGVALGFIENSSEPDDLQGWCFACEYLYQQESEMTEVFKEFNKMVVVCTICYADIKTKHFVST